jgi:hypothetical protein
VRDEAGCRAGRDTGVLGRLVAPFWVYSRSLLNRDAEERSHALTRHGLCRVLDGLHPKLRWTGRGLPLGDRNGRIVAADERGSAHATSSSMATRRRDRRGTVAADADELCPIPVRVSARLIVAS